MTWLIAYLAVGSLWGALFIVSNASFECAVLSGLLWPISMQRFAVKLMRDLRGRRR